MDLNQYQKEAKITLPDLGSEKENVVHMLFGLQTELGELIDIFKKSYAYGKEIDYIHVQEELGDIMWYWVNMCSMLGIPPDVTLGRNISKLRARYKIKFEAAEALERDLDKERKALESYDPKN